MGNIKTAFLILILSVFTVQALKFEQLKQILIENEKKTEQSLQYTIQTDLVQSSQQDQLTYIPLTYSEDDQTFHFTLAVGYPGKSFEVMLSGLENSYFYISSDDSYKSNADQYSPGSSQTYKDTGNGFNQNGLSGDVINDTSFLGVDTRRRTYDSQIQRSDIYMVTEMDTYPFGSYSGEFGLGIQQQKQYTQTILQEGYNQYQWANNTFSIYIKPTFQTENGTPQESTLIIGGMSEKFQTQSSSILFANKFTSAYSWTMTGVIISASYSTVSYYGKLDVNSEVAISGNEALIQRLYSELGYPYYKPEQALSCRTALDFKKIEINISDEVTLFLEPQNYLKSLGLGQCALNFKQSTTSSSDTNVYFGQPLLAAYYTVFDIENHQIGFTVPVAY